MRNGQTNQGSDDAFVALVQAEKSRLLNLAFRMVGDFHAAEDAVQTAFVEYHRRQDSVESAERWLTGAVLNICRNLLKRRKRDAAAMGHADMRAETADPARPAEWKEEEREVMAFLWSLSKEQRQVVLLRLYEHYTYSEIARELDLPEGTVKTYARQICDRWQHRSKKTS